MSVPSARITESVVLQRGSLRVEVSLRPFEITVYRGERRALRSLGAWVADGAVHDHFIQLTEGVVAREELSPPERAVSAVVRDLSAERLTLGLELAGGRRARLEVVIPDADRVTFVLEPERRAAARRDRLAPAIGRAFRRAGRATRHAARPVRKAWSSSAPTAATPDPDCPAELLAGGGIPQGDCAPVPWLVSSRRYAVWVQSEANGIRFDLSGDRVGASTRASAGPLVLELFCHPTPASRLRAFCRLTGFPAVLPEWGYGFWKSRDVYEHEDDVRRGLRGHDRPRHTARRDRASTRPGRPSTTPGSSTRTSSPTPSG